MAEFASPTETDFIVETAELLAQIFHCCEELQRGGREESRSRIGLALHTIKGNASAFGFPQLSKAAAILLDLFRKGVAEPDVVVRFVRETKEFLVLEPTKRKSAADFFDSFLREIESAADGEPPVREPSKPARREEVAADVAAAGATNDDGLVRAVRAILAEAPPVQPNLEELMRVASRKLKEKKDAAAGKKRRAETGAVPPQESLLWTLETHGKRQEENRPEEGAVAAAGEAAPAAAGRSESAAPATVPSTSGPLVARLAEGSSVDALCAHEALKAIATGAGDDPRLRRHIARIADFLVKVSRAQREARSVSLDECLDGWAREVRDLLGGCGVQVEIRRHCRETRVLPLIGRFVAAVLGETLRTVIWTLDSRRTPSLEVDVRSRCSEGRLVIRLEGIAYPSSSVTRGGLYAVRNRLQHLGGKIGPGDRGREIVLEVPEDLQAIDIVIVRTGKNLLGIPGHRLADLKEVGSEKIVHEETPLTELVSADLPCSSSSPEPRSYVLALRTETGQHSLLVDEIIEHQEMLIHSSVDGEDDVLSVCFYEKEDRMLPVVGFHPE